jgi:lipopolysaccharide transport system permease protein
MTKKDMSGFKTVTTAEHRLFDLHLKETFGYRDLIFLFVKRNFIADYKQTILGPLWAIINPLFNTFVFTFVFGNLAGLTISDIPGDYVLPSFLFYLSGTIFWSYF